MAQSAGSNDLLEGCFELLELVSFDDIAGLDVIVILEANTTFVVVIDFLDIILEAPQRRKLAGPDNDIVAQQAGVSISQDLTGDNIATGNGANLGDIESLADFCTTEINFLEGRREQTFHGVLDVVNSVVDNVVKTDINTFKLGQGTCLQRRADIETEDDRIRS